MRCPCLRTIGAIACLVTVTAARADAQLAELQPGARVRVRAPEAVAGRLEAVVISRSGDTVTMTTPRGGPIAVPLAAITVVEVSRGRSHRDGAVTGLISAIATDGANGGCGSEPCENDLSPGELVATSVISGATLGAGIGAIVGAEHWERLTLPVRVVVRRDRDGLTLVLGIAF
jgi:hypothetical protein